MTLRFCASVRPWARLRIGSVCPSGEMAAWAPCELDEPGATLVTGINTSLSGPGVVDGWLPLQGSATTAKNNSGRFRNFSGRKETGKGRGQVQLWQVFKLNRKKFIAFTVETRDVTFGRYNEHCQEFEYCSQIPLSCKRNSETRYHWLQLVPDDVNEHWLSTVTACTFGLLRILLELLLLHVSSGTSW